MSIGHRSKRARIDHPSDPDEEPDSVARPKPSSSDEDSDSPQRQPPVLDKRYSVEDGNLVLIAGDVAFKVYRGLLTAQSDVFKSMLYRQGESVEEYHGCPALRLEDTPEEVRTLLSVLLPKDPKPMDASCVPFDEFAVLSRISYRYQVKVVLPWAIRRLEATFPSTLEAFDQAKHVSTQDAVCAVGLGRSVDFFRFILPCAMYRCCTEKAGSFCSEEAQSNGLRAKGSELYLSASLELATRFFDKLRTMLNAGACNDCEDWPQCRVSMEILADALNTRPGLKKFRTRCDALLPWAHLYQELQGELPLCDKCYAKMEGRDLEARLRIWADLPSIFNEHVAGWPVVAPSRRSTPELD